MRADAEAHRTLDRFVALSPVSPTPVQPMDRLGATLGLRPGRLWVKRDDLTGLGGGGNKVRKLEHLCADALAQGCDTLVTGGGRQSNHVRMTAAAANHLGLACTIVLGSEPPDEPTGNVVLDQVLGARHRVGGTARLLRPRGRHRRRGRAAPRRRRRPYAMPVGGASTVGQLGYVVAALELREQLPDTALIVTADGTGGTHAGLVAGWGDHDAVLGVDVGTRPDLDDVVPREAAAAAALAGSTAPIGTCRDRPRPLRRRVRRARPRAAARPSTSPRASRGSCSTPCTRARRWPGSSPRSATAACPTDGTIVFLATGGLPALLTPRYTDWVTTGRDDLAACHHPGMPHPHAEVRAAVDAYVEVRRQIEAGEATWLDLAAFFTDDAVYVDPAWGRVEGIDEIRAFFVESMRGLEDWRFPIRFTAIDGDEVVTVWDQVLPGERPDGRRYAQTGVSLLQYAGDGRFCFEEDLLNMTHVLEDLGGERLAAPAGLREPAGQPGPRRVPAHLTAPHRVTAMRTTGRRRLDRILLGAGASWAAASSPSAARWATPSGSRRCGSAPSCRPRAAPRSPRSSTTTSGSSPSTGSSGPSRASTSTRVVTVDVGDRARRHRRLHPDRSSTASRAWR